MSLEDLWVIKLCWVYDDSYVAFKPASTAKKKKSSRNILGMCESGISTGKQYNGQAEELYSCIESWVWEIYYATQIENSKNHNFGITAGWQFPVSKTWTGESIHLPSSKIGGIDQAQRVSFSEARLDSSVAVVRSTF